MSPLAWAWVALVGLAVGSFLNVLIVRLPDPERPLFFRARSACGSCDASIAAWDNVPVLGFLWLRGRCRACRAPIGWRYPAVEVLGLVVAVVAVARLGATPAALAAAVFGWLLVAIAVTDARSLVIPDLYTVGGGAAGLAVALLAGGVGAALARALDGALVAAALGGVAWGVGRVVGKRVMGDGDVVMVAFLAVWLGFGGAVVAIGYGALGALVVFAGHVVPAVRIGRVPVRAVAVLGYGVVAGAGVWLGGQWFSLAQLLLLVAALPMLRRSGGRVADLEVPFGTWLAVGAAAVWAGAGVEAAHWIEAWLPWAAWDGGWSVWTS